MKIEDSLNGGYGGLYGEVVTEDCYRLKQLDFMPDIVFDIGANVGVFSKYVRTMWLTPKIIAVEPDPDNCKIYETFNIDATTVLIKKAIGNGKLWKVRNAENGAHETYLTECTGFPLENCDPLYNIEEAPNIETIMVDELVDKYLKDGMKSVMKIDIEGNDNAIFEHKPSLDAIKKIDYVCMEVHQFALTQEELPKVKLLTLQALTYIEQTHNVIFEGVNLYARKR
jgi:FkbM family methyltransferase